MFNLQIWESWQKIKVSKLKLINHSYPFKRQPHKMVKHTQTIRRLTGDEMFECVWPFCGVGA